MIMKGIIATVTRAVRFKYECTSLRFSTCQYEKMNWVFYIPGRNKVWKLWNLKQEKFKLIDTVTE